MRRELLGSWGEELSDPELGAALAAPFSALPITDRGRIVGPFFPWATHEAPLDPQGWTDDDSRSFLERWRKRVGQSVRPETPTRFGVSVGVVLEALRIVPGVWTPAARTWFLDILSRGELVSAAHAVTAPAQPAAEWLWPLDVALVDPSKSRDLQAMLRQFRWKDFLNVESATRATNPIEILAFQTSLDGAVTELRRMSKLPRVQTVLVLGGRGRTDDPIKLAENLRRLARADAVCVAEIPEPNLPDVFDAFFRELAHDIDLDVALNAALREHALLPPLMVACDGGFAQARISAWAHQIATRLSRAREPRVPAMRMVEAMPSADGFGTELDPPVARFAWGRESSEATDMAALGAAVRDEHPPPRERRVQAELRDESGATVESAPLKPDQTYRLDVWIGEPVAGVLVAPAAFPEERLPPSVTGHLLTVVLTTASFEFVPQVRTLQLPPTGATERAQFELPIPRIARVHARVTVLHENRIVQTIVLEASVGSGDSVPLGLCTEGVIRRDLDSLGGRRPFDVALLFNDAAGTATMSAFKDGEASLVRSDRLKEFLDTITEQLEDATNRPTLFGPPDNKASSQLLGDLARQGSLLREELMEMGDVRKQLAGAKRIQIVAAKGEEVLPLELCYEAPAPKIDAKMCPQWKPALATGECHPDCPKDRRTVICPVAFWGTSKCIERHAYSQERAAGAGANDFAILEREPSGGRRLPIRGNSLCAAASKARAKDPAAVDRAFQAAAQAVGTVGASNEVADWESWKKAIEDKTPRLLVLLPHTEVQRSLQVMVIADKAIAQLTDVSAELVGKGDGPGPLVLLFGCSTSKKQGLQSFTTKFRRAGAVVVVGTLCKILGRHSGAIAAHLLEKLEAAANDVEPTSIGDLMTKLRRELLAEGYPIVFALAAFGDADWSV